MVLDAALNVLALSDTSDREFPSCSKMLEAPDECLSAHIRNQIKVCTTLVVQQVYKQIQTFLLVLEGVSLTNNGAKSTPVLAKG